MVYVEEEAENLVKKYESDDEEMILSANSGDHSPVVSRDCQVASHCKSLRIYESINSLLFFYFHSSPPWRALKPGSGRTYPQLSCGGGGREREFGLSAPLLPLINHLGYCGTGRRESHTHTLTHTCRHTAANFQNKKKRKVWVQCWCIICLSAKQSIQTK